LENGICTKVGYLKQEGQNCNFNIGDASTKSSNCDEGLNCIASTEAGSSGDGVCQKISTTKDIKEACDFTGANPELGFCKKGLSCVEVKGSSQPNLGVCLTISMNKKKGQVCGRNAATIFGQCDSELECIQVDGITFLDIGICA
jgi:hypothetical protein